VSKKKTDVKRIVVVSLGMTVIMACCMSFAMTFVAMGFAKPFVHEWLKGWWIGGVVALPFAFLVPMLMNKICDKIFK
jgi:hypothetical protein